ncbi:MAG: Bifunctional ligase/repressor BirA [Chlamydiales bacterium]|nr:Bifunctional ligase/repressor BirA [Chlamydiales bacterium]MCH9635702.1 Bifunctional ligase/repressor BirA [Chlamydiales bacterium]MCH9704489.1 biotin--[acetyl-CoA-carboxylase] ligase [Chlamydiota bacterium]
MELIHHRFDSISSTNDWAKEQVATFDRSRVTIISADFQTQGRGQYGRQWLSPPKKNLYATFCFFLENGQKEALSLTHVMAIAIAQLLEEEDIPAQIKWPNDVLVHGKKIAGILCETVECEDQTAIIVGLGMNINMTHEEFATVGRPATSFFIEKERLYDRADLTARLEELFVKALDQFLERGFTPFLPIFRRLVFRS